MTEESSVVDSFIEVELNDKSDFLKIIETLSRIGIASYKNKDEQGRPSLVQTCHLLHKRDRDEEGKSRYFVVHFKEMFLLDGREADFTEDDRARRNCIAKLLEEWGLVTIVTPEKITDPVASLGSFKIIKYVDKDDWNLVAKYTIGKK